MNREVLNEKWYQFIRYYCTDGTIDVWAGDSANDRNNETKSKININQSTCFVRVNDSDSNLKTDSVIGTLLFMW